MNIDLLNGFINGGLGLVFKILMLLVILLYGVFAAVVARQVYLMNEVVHQVKFSSIILGMALIHLGVTVFLFVIALIVL
ncbi:hypothetical protein HYS29_00655 [Candidatus Microgenomates bacterium]|nr:hypothetical protein [Candidatus Microgenomates bacterium]